MKKFKIVAIILSVIALVGIIAYTHNQRKNYNGICSNCGDCTHEVGQVFPYTQYKCHGCGNIDLGC
jgi:hypothetical protein